MAVSILDSGKEYSSLSPRQRWRVDNTIDMLLKLGEAGTDSDKTEKAVATENKTYNLDDQPEMLNMVNTVISEKDSEKIAALKDPLLIKIANSVLRNKRISDKQLKHIKAGFDALK